MGALETIASVFFASYACIRRCTSGGEACSIQKIGVACYRFHLDILALTCVLLRRIALLYHCYEPLLRCGSATRVVSLPSIPYVCSSYRSSLLQFHSLPEFRASEGMVIQIAECLQSEKRLIQRCSNDLTCDYTKR